MSTKLAVKAESATAHILVLAAACLLGMAGLGAETNKLRALAATGPREVFVEVPEVYELANVAIAITEEGLNHPYRVQRQGAYYSRVLEHFKPFKNHPLIAQPDLNRNYGYFFRDNSFCYVFDREKIVHRAPYSHMRLPNLFGKHLALAEDFARVTSFRKFYRDNQAYYRELEQLYRRKVPLRRMWVWLEERFPIRYDQYRIVFSPLIGSSHETCQFETNGFTETLMFMCGPGEPDEVSGEVGDALLARAVFTEIDHNYVNPTTRRYASRVNEAFADVDRWNHQDNYRSAEMTFNEYMTWAVFFLYAHDTYKEKTFEAVREQVNRQMVTGRKFVRFGEFSAQLLKLYLEQAGKASIPDLYPALLVWAEGK